MNRGVITISESGTVSMPTDTVWMTMLEIADMYNVFGCYVRKAVKAIFKDGILKEQGVRRHVRKNDRISYDVYSLELVIAVAFRIDSIESRAFREFIMQSVIGTETGRGRDSSNATQSKRSRLTIFFSRIHSRGCASSVRKEMMRIPPFA